MSNKRRTRQDLLSNNRFARKLSYEPLEARRVLTTFVVNSVDDNSDGFCDGQHCSLREAIQQANSTPEKDQILFDIVGDGPHEINFEHALPWIVEPVTIDGFSQIGNRESPGIILNGSSITSLPEFSQAGVVFQTTDSALLGMSIVGFPDAGVLLNEAVGVDIQGNWIGVHPDGAVANGNGSAGVDLFSSGGNLIGGEEAWQKNVISGNKSDGVLVRRNGIGSNSIIGNVIGTDPTGQFSIPNERIGVWVTGNADTIYVRSNLISGNGRQGILVNDAFGVVITDNTIGLNIDGNFQVANRNSGIRVSDGAFGVLISSNVISGNESDGVEVRGDATLVEISDNKIGTDIGGAFPIGNGSDGIQISNSGDSVHASDMLIVDNTVSGNFHNGVLVTGRITDVEILSNSIGVTSDESAAIGNSQDGVRLIRGARKIRVGGEDPDSGNVIGGNGDDGIAILSDGSDNNEILNNWIGVNRRGEDLGNVEQGILVQTGPNGTQIGRENSGNVIGGNGAGGVYLFGRVSNTQIEGNHIGRIPGTDLDSGNRGSGVYIRGSGLFGAVPKSIIFVVDKSESAGEEFDGQTALSAQIDAIEEFVNRFIDFGLGEEILVGATVFDSTGL